MSGLLHAMLLSVIMCSFQSIVTCFGIYSTISSFPRSLLLKCNCVQALSWHLMYSSSAWSGHLPIKRSTALWNCSHILHLLTSCSIFGIQCLVLWTNYPPFSMLPSVSQTCTLPNTSQKLNLFPSCLSPEDRTRSSFENIAFYLKYQKTAKPRSLVDTIPRTLWNRRSNLNIILRLINMKNYVEKGDRIVPILTRVPENEFCTLS
jgi:hypothetical protein